MGNVPSKPSTDPFFSASIPTAHTAHTTFGPALAAPPALEHAAAPSRSSFSVESPTKKDRRLLLHQRSHSHTPRPVLPRSIHNSDSGIGSGMSQHDLAVAHDSTDSSTHTLASTSSAANSSPVESPAGLADSKTARADSAIETIPAATALLLDKPLPASPLPHPPTVPEKDPQPGSAPSTSSPKATLGPHPPQNGLHRIAAANTTRTSSLSQQSIHSQSSMSDKSILSNSSGSGSRSDGSTRATATSTPSTSVAGGTTESLGQLSLQRFPTGESDYKTLPMARSRTADHAPRHSHEINVLKASRTTSTVSSSSARSSSGSSGFKFPKPNLFKPLLHSHGHDSKNQHPHPHLYEHHPISTPAASAEGHHRSRQHHHQLQHRPDLLAHSPFPLVLLSIELPQSLLDKYVLDLDGFRHGKGIWGIGRYSWTVTVLSRSTGKKYVVKRVSKSLLPPSAYYHYPTTAHRLCTCPACKSSREQLLLTGQLDQKELDNMQEVLIIENKGSRKELSQHKQPPSISAAATREGKDKKKSSNLYSYYNSSMPNQQAKFLTLSSSSSPQTSPVNSRPSTPSPSPLRLSSTPMASTPAPKSPKAHNRSQSHHAAAVQNALPHSPLHSPLLPSATPLSWSHKDRDLTVPQTMDEQLSRRPHSPSSRSEYIATAPPTRLVPRSVGTSHSRNKQSTLRRHKSTPNLSRTVTGLDVLEDDPRQRQLSQLQHGKDHLHHTIPEAGRRLFDSPLTATSTMPSMHLVVAGKESREEYLEPSDSDNVDSGRPRSPWSAPITERRVGPLDTNDGEFKQMEPESPRSPKNPEPRGFVPPPHALPMELVLLQTYNDSDHLPEHHEWTQDKDYWYYVTKAHGVKRRKLKKVSTWWLEVGSLGNVLLPGSSSTSEPIATGPIYSMGHGTGNTTPMTSSPLSSEATLSRTSVNGRHTPKDSVSSMSSQDQLSSTMSYPSSFSTIRRQSSPRNSHMGKYFYVDWDEYTSL